MDYGKLFSRSFEITRKHRALWLFGFLLALFSAGSSGGNGNRVSSDASLPFESPFPEIDPMGLAPIIFAVVCIALILIAIAVVLSIVSRGALIGLVAELETEQTPPTVRRGFGIGANRFWQFLGLTLLVYAPIFIVGGILGLLVLLPAFSALTRLTHMYGVGVDEELLGQFAAMGLGSLVLFACVACVFVVLLILIHPLYQFFIRECVIQKRGVFDSVRAGWARVRAHAANIAMLYVLTIAIGIGFGVLMIPVAFILIGIPVALAAGAGMLSGASIVGVVVGAILGIPAVLLLLFIGGLYQVFDSTLWTEAYLAT